MGDESASGSISPHSHHIDLDDLTEFAHLGIRRGVVFLGLGLNAAYREDFLDYELSRLPVEADVDQHYIEFIPDSLPIERVSHFKVEFGKWVKSCCLRDMLEHHAVLLDKIHLHALVVAQSRGEIRRDDDPETLHSRFRYEGIPGKHKILRTRFAISPTYSGTVDQLYEVRNALTHDFGILLPKRCDSEGNFVLRWPKFDFFGVGSETGKETPLYNLIGQTLSEETTVMLRLGERKTTYKEGDQISFDQRDLEEFFHFFAGWVVPSTVAAFADFLKANGVEQLSKRQPRTNVVKRSPPD